MVGFLDLEKMSNLGSNESWSEIAPAGLFLPLWRYRVEFSVRHPLYGGPSPPIVAKMSSLSISPGTAQPFSQALEKLTSQSVSSLGSPFLSSMVYSASQRLEFGIRGGGAGGGISDKKMECVLKVINCLGCPESSK